MPARRLPHHARAIAALLGAALGACHDAAGPLPRETVTIAVAESLFAAPLAVAIGDTLDLQLRVLDEAAGAVTRLAPAVTADTSGVVEVLPGGRVRVVGSGWVDLTVRAGGARLVRRLRVYAPPAVAERHAAGFSLAGMPAGVNPWAPTLVALPNGAVRLYFAAYVKLSTDIRSRANLDYFESTDTLRFTYGGTAIAKQPLIEDPYGHGIENVVMVPRNDGPGYRLFFAGGSHGGGWQVFSAVGDGTGPWTVEPGVRISNGDLHLYAQGEGMVVLPRAGGGYRMILGSMYLTATVSNSWSILEFHSDDQLSWRYARPVLRPGVPGSGLERAVYSPSITPFGRGAYRMFFTGDDRGRVVGGGKSQTWSAVSFDLLDWTVEGVAIPAVEGHVFYTTVVGDRLVHILMPFDGGVNRIEMARVAQR